MAKHITGIKTRDGVKKIDYNSLANLPGKNGVVFNGVCVYPSEGLEYTLSDDGTYYICSGIGGCVDSIVYIPDTHNGLPVKGISGLNAEHLIIPRGVEELTNESIDENGIVSFGALGEVKYIYEWAFDSATGLKKVVLPDSVLYIGERAFCRTWRLETFDFPAQLQTIEKSAFSYSGLSKVIIPDSVITIGDSAFEGLRRSEIAVSKNIEVVIGSGVTSIGSKAFYYGNSLTKVTMRCKSAIIASDAFSSNTNLKTINVSWSQGEVAGAPWGASNATINYNYTGE